MEENWKVYIHVVHTSHGDMRYVGITGKICEKRWRNGNGYFNNDHFYKAIQKYGWDNIEHIIIAENLSKKDACNMEINLIEYFKTQNRNFGYNSTRGGDGVNGSKWSKERYIVMKEKLSGKNNHNYGKHLSQETKDKISNSLKGIPLSEERKNNVAKAHRGFKFSEEAKKHMSESKKGKYIGEKNWRYGVHLSESTKEKIAMGNRGRILSQKSKEKMSEAKNYKKKKVI